MGKWYDANFGMDRDMNLDAVQGWQNILLNSGANITVDGVFGPQTTALTKAWQAAHGLPADGIVGPMTWEAVGTPGLPTIQEGKVTTISPIKTWQDILIADGLLMAGTSDGVFGPKTTTATKMFQGQHGLVQDGIVGPQSWAAAGKSGMPTIQGASAPSPSPAPAPAPGPKPSPRPSPAPSPTPSPAASGFLASIPRAVLYGGAAVLGLGAVWVATKK